MTEWWSIVRVTGRRPGEVNKPSVTIHRTRLFPGDDVVGYSTCRMLTRSTPLDTPRPCKLAAGHEGICE